MHITWIAHTQTGIIKGEKIYWHQSSPLAYQGDVLKERRNLLNSLKPSRVSNCSIASRYKQQMFKLDFQT